VGSKPLWLVSLWGEDQDMNTHREATGKPWRRHLHAKEGGWEETDSAHSWSQASGLQDYKEVSSVMSASQLVVLHYSNPANELKYGSNLPGRPNRLWRRLEDLSLGSAPQPQHCCKNCSNSITNGCYYRVPLRWVFLRPPWKKDTNADKHKALGVGSWNSHLKSSVFQ
jgi:hypothetical protein